MSSLKVRLKNGLELADPFMVASSHLTAGTNNFEHLSAISPSAITIKTISKKFGGENSEKKESRTLKAVKNWNGNYIGLYADGPKKTELFGPGLAHDMIKAAKRILPTSKIGISVLQGEEYEDIKVSLARGCEYDFVELNLKYSLRLDEDGKKDIARIIGEINDDCENFCKVFHDRPKFIKFSREMEVFLDELARSPFFNTIEKNNVVVIVANSKKCIAPPSYSSFQHPNPLLNGVIVGDYLFLDTYNFIYSLNNIFDGEKNGRISASGGISSIGEIIDCIALGVNSFQICSLIQQRGKFSIEMLRCQLSACLEYFKCRDFTEFREFITSNPEKVKELNNIFINKTKIVEAINSQAQKLIDTFLMESKDGDLLKNDYPETKNQSAVKLAGTDGTVLSYALTFCLASGNYCTELVSSKEISKGGYDSVIISDAYKDDFCKIHHDWVSSKIGNACYSLMSVAEDMNDIKRIFLFESLSSDKMKIEIQKMGEYEFTYIKPLELASLLISWKDDMGILAKKPLTDLYSILMPDNLSKKWHSLYNCGSPIWLIAKKEVNEAVSADIKNLIINIRSKPEVVVKNLLNHGFDRYLANFLYRDASV
ncbi:MAG: hypothetical protein LBH44_08495 [Treponema sp.]|jgi:dihydroorotate dehydrogenase|nr:hypothetical protein [Treponema sp.]